MVLLRVVRQNKPGGNCSSAGIPPGSSQETARAQKPTCFLSAWALATLGEISLSRLLEIWTGYHHVPASSSRRYQVGTPSSSKLSWEFQAFSSSRVRDARLEGFNRLGKHSSKYIQAWVPFYWRSVVHLC